MVERKNEKHGHTKCWEHKKCGRQKGGCKSKELYACPAYPDNGRFCWRVAGTLCDEKVQGTFAQKMKTCLHCKFYKKVKEEEGEDFDMLGIERLTWLKSG
ncbi:MAG: hypothetical protein C4562_05310 [Actinobacteria bacterium]|nr:MAG: hypothetical protein C4562_05310 [Actinomycetota bacterium]